MPRSRARSITSGKETFCGGADLTMLETHGARYSPTLASTKARRPPPRWCSTRAASSRSSIGGSKPAASRGSPRINGTAMGGGFELALACHHRVAADNPKTRLGLPEIKVGLFPGAGGTQRIARMMQPADALQFLLKGDQLRLDRAKAMKLIDDVVPPADLIKAAKDWIKAGGKAEAPWDEEGFKLPGGPVYSKAGMMTLPAANAIYRRETYDNYPARARDPAGRLRRPAGAVRHGAAHRVALVRQDPALAGSGGDDPLAVRLDAGAEQGRAPPAERAADDAQEDRRRRRRLHGRRHRLCDAPQAGIEVVLIDRDQETADKGKAALHKALIDRVDQRAASKGADRDALLARITPTADYAALEGLRSRDRGRVRGPQGEGRGDREGAGRDRRQRDLRAPTPRRCRSPRSPSEFKDPARFIGIHFFSPVERMMLVEIIMGKKTGDRRSPPRSITCARSARRRSSSTTRAASTPRAWSAPISAKAT